MTTLLRAHRVEPGWPAGLLLFTAMLVVGIGIGLWSQSRGSAQTTTTGTTTTTSTTGGP